MQKLTQSTIENLQYYVYLLIDPRTNQPFYVGKGHGNRVNQHVLGALETEIDEVEKIKTIHEIQASGLEVGHLILRHGLTEKESLEVESAVIDVLGINNLTNIVAGHYAAERGLMTLEDIVIKYQAKDAEFNEPVLLININRLYHHDISQLDLYEATRKYWHVDLQRVSNIHLICAVYAGIIREVYVPTDWKLSAEFEGRSYFAGSIASNDIRDSYINRSVAKFWKQGSQNPIKYVKP
jgi:hypothetical protein